MIIESTKVKCMNKTFFFDSLIQIPEQYQGRFMKGLSLPQICQNLIKAAHDPRIAGVALAVEPLACGWGKLDEIRRHLEYFKQSGVDCFKL